MQPASRPTEPLSAVLGVLRLAGALTRAEVAERTGLSRTTVSGVLKQLQRRHLIAEIEDPPVATGGRPAVRIALQPAAGLAIGVDVGRTHLRVVAVDLGHRRLAQRFERLAADDHMDDVLDAATTLVDDVLAEAGYARGDVLGVGLGVPAPLDAAGQVGSSSILPGWLGRAPAAELARRLGMVVHTENDANLGALAEAHWGAGRDSRLLVYVKAATGIGAGIVVEGRLFRGANGSAGELGHMTIHDGGEVCRCGNRGCLELQAGGRAMLAQIRHHGDSPRTLTELVQLALEGDAAARRVLLDAADQIGLALSNLVNLLNPDLIVMGGELSSAGDLLLSAVEARIQRSSIASASSVMSIRRSELGDEAEALGGALLVTQELERFDLERFEGRCRALPA